jgi:hypothetical protein
MARRYRYGTVLTKGQLRVLRALAAGGQLERRTRVMTDRVVAADGGRWKIRWHTTDTLLAIGWIERRANTNTKYAITADGRAVAERGRF